MATPLIGTAIITGGNGALGSEVAIAVAKTQPLIHLLLTARDIDENESVHRLAERVRQIGPRSLEIVKLDLADLDQVATFGKFTVRRVRQKTIPPVVLLINSAATLSYTRDDFTQDGFDPVYQVNCLSPFLLTVTLLEAFKANGPLVMNIGCSAISEGRLDYFDGNRRTGKSADRRTSLTAKEGSVRFGSSKLLMSAAMYGLRRSLRSVSRKKKNAYLVQ
jgi:mannan polymerase II complex ANP1 subunit